MAAKLKALTCTTAEVGAKISPHSRVLIMSSQINVGFPGFLGTWITTDELHGAI